MANQNQKAPLGPTNQFEEATYRRGDLIGEKYEIISLLGKGGFGEVYLAYLREYDTVCALKTFRNEFLSDARLRDLFRKEANTIIELGRYPYLVQTYAVEEFSGRLFVALEYIAPNEDGINSLAGYLEHYSPGLIQSLRWAIQICLGMECAFGKGVRTHRDLKPENIMISQDQIAKVTDFGLAGILNVIPKNYLDSRDYTDLVGKTQVGAAFGTPTHMSPEQFNNAANCDMRSDIYSLGVVLFQMATGGNLPFLAALPENRSQKEQMRFWVEMQQFHNEARVPRLDSPLFPVIQRCLEKNPEKRYQSFRQLRSDLETVLKKQNGEVIKVPKSGDLAIHDLINKAASLQTLGRYEEAIVCSNNVLKLDPRNADALANIGTSLQKLGRYKDAIQYYIKALEINPNHINAVNNAGVLLQEMGLYKEAIGLFDNSLQLHPRDVKTLNNKGTSLHHLGHYQEAIRYFDKALEINPQFSAALSNKGLALVMGGSYEEAIRFCDDALKIDPLDVNGLITKGVGLGKLGRYEQAIESYDSALAIDPRNYGILYNKATCLENLGRKQEAVQSYRQFLSVVPSKQVEIIDQVQKSIRKLEGGNATNIFKTLFQRK